MGLISWIRRKVQGFDDEVAARRPAASATYPSPPPLSRRSFTEARDHVTSEPRHRLGAPIDDSARRRREEDRRRRQEEHDASDAVGFDVFPATFTDASDRDSGGRHHLHDSGNHHYEAPSSSTTSHDSGGSYGGGSSSYGGGSDSGGSSGGGGDGGGSF